jgi:hypothetical protein
MTAQYMEQFKGQLAAVLRRGATLRIFDRNWQLVQTLIPDWAVRLEEDTANRVWLLRLRPVGLWKYEDGRLDWDQARCFAVDSLAQIEEMDGVPPEERTIGIPAGAPTVPKGGLRIFGAAAFGYNALLAPGTGDYDWPGWVAARRALLEARPEELARWEALTE